MKIEIYTKSTCPYCYRAKDLLAKKKLKFTEYDLLDNPELMDEIEANILAKIKGNAAEAAEAKPKKSVELPLLVK